MGKTLKQRQQETGRTLALNGKAWRTLREVVLARDPLCRCGCGQPSTDVDHIDNDPCNNDMDNLQGLAHACHSVKTASGRLPVRFAADGLPQSGPWAKTMALCQKSPATGPTEPCGYKSFYRSLLKK